MILSPEIERTNQHYDLDHRVFGLFLDSSMKYSCGLYLNDTDSLNQAQLQKLDFIADSLGLRGGERVLDIGCGWGSLLLHLSQRYQCTTVGVTPSGHQTEFVQTKAQSLGIEHRVSVITNSVEAITLPNQAFDAITLIGSIVHMRDKQDILARCYKACRPNGRVYLSETCFRNWSKLVKFRDRPGTRFVRDDIFGWAELLPLSSLIECSEDAGFSLESVKDLTDDYSRTIQDWSLNISKNRSQIESLSPGMPDNLIKYMDIASAALRYTVKHYAIVVRKRR